MTSQCPILTKIWRDVFNSLIQYFWNFLRISMQLSTLIIIFPSPYDFGRQLKSWRQPPVGEGRGDVILAKKTSCLIIMRSILRADIHFGLYQALNNIFFSVQVSILCTVTGTDYWAFLVARKSVKHPHTGDISDAKIFSKVCHLRGFRQVIFWIHIDFVEIFA